MSENNFIDDVMVGTAKNFVRAAFVVALIYSLSRLGRREWLWLAMMFGLPVIAIVVMGTVHPVAGIPVLAYWLYCLVATVINCFREIPERQYANQLAYEQEVAAQQQAYAYEQQRQAQATGQAVVDGLRQAYQETQRPPEDPPAAAPTAPAPTPPTPPSPMGSSSPTLWVPTYQGPRRELQRRETSLEGLWINDHRRVDPDDL